MKHAGLKRFLLALAAGLLLAGIYLAVYRARCADAFVCIIDALYVGGLLVLLAGLGMLVLNMGVFDGFSYSFRRMRQVLSASKEKEATAASNRQPVMSYAEYRGRARKRYACGGVLLAGGLLLAVSLVLTLVKYL